MTERRFVEHVMGMPITMVLRGAESALAEAAWRAVIDELRWVDEVFSTYRDDSWISRLGRGEVGVRDCPPEVDEVLSLGRTAYRASGAAFSVWLPDADGRSRFDPSGVVKGWAVERAAGHVGHPDFCLSAGGDMVCRTDDRPWRVGIEHPLDPARLVAVVPVRNGAVATSGTAHRGQHISDARTGTVPEGLASVTVVGPSLTWADIYATAAFAMGQSAVEWLRSRADHRSLVVWADGSTDLVEPGARHPAASGF
ncbi:MAG: FAD:protein FMN transferase [Candidatus Nanopelagicales bacterium]